MEASPYLKTREWIIVILYCGILAAITLVSQVLVPRERPELIYEHQIKSPFIEVSIAGAVEFPGIYSLPKGSITSDLIKKAKPLPNADLTKLKWTARLLPGKHVRIPFIEMVTVRIEGEVVEPITIKTEKGTELKQLFDIVAFTDFADKTSLMKKKTH